MKYLGILLLILFSMSIRAQQGEQNVLQDFYQDILHPSDPLLNGREYEYYFQPRISSPLIPKDQLPSASVLIRGKLYQKVMLLYDTYKDLLVYYNPNTLYINMSYDTYKDLLHYNPNTLYNNMSIAVIVNSNIIEEFTLQLQSGPARFKYLSFPEHRDGLLSSGFYEIVSEGACKFIIDHSAYKKTQDSKVVYQHKTERYIINSGAVFKIKGKNSLLKAFSDEAPKVKEYLKETKIYVGTADKEQIKRVLEYYTGLKH